MMIEEDVKAAGERNWKQARVGERPWLLDDMHMPAPFVFARTWPPWITALL